MKILHLKQANTRCLVTYAISSLPIDVPQMGALPYVEHHFSALYQMWQMSTSRLIRWSCGPILDPLKHWKASPTVPDHMGLHPCLPIDVLIIHTSFRITISELYNQITSKH